MCGTPLVPENILSENLDAVAIVESDGIFVFSPSWCVRSSKQKARINESGSKTVPPLPARQRQSPSVEQPRHLLVPPHRPSRGLHEAAAAPFPGHRRPGPRPAAQRFALRAIRELSRYVRSPELRARNERKYYEAIFRHRLRPKTGQLLGRRGHPHGVIAEREGTAPSSIPSC